MNYDAKKNDAINGDARLERLAQEIGARAAERLDVAATAQKVVERLRAGEQPAQRPRWISPVWLRIAAAVVVVIGGGLVLRQATFGDRQTAHSAHFVADDLSDLNAEQLQDMLGNFDEIVGGTAATDSGDLRELDAQQLRAVLRSLEG